MIGLWDEGYRYRALAGAGEMPFPESGRVRYRRNPLAQVICQLKFPPILRVEAQPPVAFQESVRARFPIYEEQRPLFRDLPLPDDLEKVLRENLQIPAGRLSFLLQSEDARWRLSLSRDSISLTDSAYTLWEDFADCLAPPLQALEVEYQPTFYTRIGLRYQNLIQRSKLGLIDVPWGELLQPFIAGELSQETVADFIETSARDITLRLKDDTGRLHLKHGLVGPREGSQEVCYLLDADFFANGKLERDDALKVLKHFNRKAARLFRWCISDRLHQAMEPEPLPDRSMA